MIDSLRKLVTDAECGIDACKSTFLQLQKPVEGNALELAYWALIETLLGENETPLIPSVTRAGAPLLSSYDPKGVICHPNASAELAAIWSRVGALRRCPKLQKAGTRGLAFLHQLHDKWHRPFAGLWLGEQEKIIEFQKFTNDLDLGELPPSYDLELGFAIHHTKRHSLALALTGWDTGLGSIMGDDVGILAFGPGQFPKQAIGIHLTPYQLNELSKHQDLPGHTQKRHGSIFHFAGWTKVVTPQHLWCQMNVQCKDDVHLSLQFLDLKNMPISMCMAVKANSLRIGDQLELAHGSLRRYDGPVKTIALEGKRSQMVIMSQKGSMQIIPLAGDASYWGADYLLIYPFEEGLLRHEWNIY